MPNSRALILGGLVAVTVIVVSLDFAGIINGPVHRALPSQAAPAPQATYALPQGGQVVNVLDPTNALNSPTPTKNGLIKALGPVVSAPALGKDVAVVVLDGAEGAQLYARRPDRAQDPASTQKLVTALTALATLGSDTTIETKVVDNGSSITLVGGGDPTLTRKRVKNSTGNSLNELAALTAAQLKQRNKTRVALTFDDSAFTGPTTQPSWPAAYVASGVIAPVTALQTDGGRPNPATNARTSDPSAQAGKQFAQALALQGITVVGPIKRGVAAEGAQQLAGVRSPAITNMVETMLTTSNDGIAEALAHLAGLRTGNGGSFEGGVKATRRVLDNFNVSQEGAAFFDGSGLSRDDLATPLTIAQVIYTASRSRDRGLRSLLSGLPIAGLTGTLADRFDTSGTKVAGGVARGKTGTLTGVSSLAGTVVDKQGHLLVFVILADQLSTGGTLQAREAIDRFVATLASCGCQ